MNSQKARQREIAHLSCQNAMFFSKALLPFPVQIAQLPFCSSLHPNTTGNFAIGQRAFQPQDTVNLKTVPISPQFLFHFSTGTPTCVTVFSSPVPHQSCPCTKHDQAPCTTGRCNCRITSIMDSRHHTSFSRRLELCRRSIILRCASNSHARSDLPSATRYLRRLCMRAHVQSGIIIHPAYL